MRGVDCHSAVGVKLYEKLVHPSTDLREKISDDLYKSIKEHLGSEDWKIYEPGIGGGWIDLCIIRKIINDENGPANVSLYGIDSSHKMLDEFKNNIISNFDKTKVIPDKDCAYKISIKENKKKNITISHYHQNCLELENFEDSINIILIFFLFHHLGNEWYNELRKYINKINNNGLIILSEVGGDQACWSYSFDKIYNFDELT